MQPMLSACIAGHFGRAAVARTPAMRHAAAEILSHLTTVAAERSRRRETPALMAAVSAAKAFQQRRFIHTYQDLLGSQRYGAAATFFLDELYGPSDFTERDAQFARAVPSLVRLFPQQIVETVLTLAAVHSLSERLDTEVGAALLRHRGGGGVGEIDGDAYISAWQLAGQAAERERQIALILDVASRLDRLTTRPLLRNSLRLMRGPARAAGLSDLQRFLERGFDSFRAMEGATEFIAMIRARETALAGMLFSATHEQPSSASWKAARRALP